MIFVDSMSDLFHEDVPDDYVHQVVQVMQTANRHTYQVLTRRSERLRDLLLGWEEKGTGDNRENGEGRVASLFPLLPPVPIGFKRTPAGEPHIWWGVSVENRKHGLPRIEHLRAAAPAMAFLSIEPLLEDIGKIDLNGIHWVIVGGESGPGARPMSREWVINIQKECHRARVPFFFK